MELLKNSKRFSFKLDGVSAWEKEYTVSTEERENELITTYLFEGGLKITNIARKYEKHGAYEWVNHLENTGSEPTEVISELFDCDVTLPMPHEDPKKATSYIEDKNLATQIYNPAGSTWHALEFATNIHEIRENNRINHIFPGMTKRYVTNTGRSSEEKAPFFNVHKDGKGYIFAVGWTGQWYAEITRGEDDITFRSKINDTKFRILPGEKFRTSSIVILPYECDVVDSQNKWRRLVKEHFSPFGEDKAHKFGPLCVALWGGMPSADAIERINAVAKANIPADYIWMDAGWYGKYSKPTSNEFEGDWPSHTGDWRVSPQTHPNGLVNVAETVKSGGYKFLLWFEPERVTKVVEHFKDHPDYYLHNGNEDCWNKLLNLGDERAWQYCYDTLCNHIENLDIKCYRQDFNFAPLGYFRSGDDRQSTERSGITEIKHINGMYKLWDALLERFPDLLIDNCASGGRRIDIETMRRSIPLWRSDYECHANYDVEVAQCHHLSYNTWLPYSGTGAGRICDEYRIRSAYDASLATMSIYSLADGERLDEKIAFLKKYFDVYLTVRPYFSEDFYPLSEVSDKLDVWCAAQFDRPSQKDGIVQVFRRENSPYECATYNLRGIDEDATYLVTDLDGGDCKISGKKLADGFKVTIFERRKAKIFKYQQI